MASAETDATSGTRKAPAGRSWLRTFLMITLTVVIPLCLYYFVYAAWSAAEMQRRNLRVLVATARHIADNSTRRAKVLLWAMPQAPITVDANEKALCAGIEERLKNSGLLERADCKRDWSRSADGKPSVQVTLSEGAAGPIYVVEASGTGVRVRATAPLRDLIPFDDTAQGDFDAVVVRRLELQQNGDAPKVGAVLVDNTDFSPDLIERVSSTPPAVSSPPAAGSATWSPPDFLQFRDHPRSKIAKEEYVTFAVPLTLHEIDRVQFPKPIMLSVEGLVSPGRLRSQALALSPNVLTYVICAIIAAVLTLPYLKIRFMARRERLRRLDLGLLAATALGGTALGTMLISHGAGRVWLREWMDKRMAQVGVSMQTAVGTEVALIKQQLDESAGALIRDQGCNPGADAPADKVQAKFLLEHPGGPYPDFESIFCTDKKGDQLRKWLPRGTTSPPLPVGSYPYFRRAMTLPVPRDGTGDGNGDSLVFASVSARTTGLRLAVFA
jgi:hypothetical protein